MEVHLFSWVILMNVLRRSGDLICRILHAVYATCFWMFYHANGISETPSQSCSFRIKILPVTGWVRKAESLDLTMSGRDIGCCEVDI